jgi:glycosidase
MTRYRLVLLSLFFFSITWLPAQVRIDPSSWWIGMKNPKLQLCVHAPLIASYTPGLNYNGVTIAKVNMVENPNYLFIDLEISPKTVPGIFIITFKPQGGGKALYYTYELHQKDPGDGTSRIRGINSSDLVYLLMPDRFSNGDPSNDIVAGSADETVDRSNLKARHGGDIQGVINHIDDIQNLGVTAVWMTPLTENNQPYESYHGYAITDHYRIDPRMGTNDLFTEYVNTAQSKGLKVIQDVVYNHIGSNHWFYKDLPSSDWVHQFDTFTRTTYKDMALFDPHASDSDRHVMSNGWFDKHMPDLNQRNPFLATYLIQNTIWWIEYAGIDGLRIDTWAYPDLEFENKLMEALLNEFPQLGIFGETWVQGIANQSYFVQNNYSNLPYHSKLPGVTDFQLYYATLDALNTDFGWESGSNKWYRMMANDFVYKDPNRNVLFLDNHDLSRFYSMIKQDYDKWRIGMTFLLTCRGIPCIYTGTEYLSSSYASLGAIEVREDYPGGFPGDIQNNFDAGNLNGHERDAHNFIRTLAGYRKNSTALGQGKLMQYAPLEGEYVFFRYDSLQTILVALNPTNKAITLNLNRYYEQVSRKGYTGGQEIISGQLVSFEKGFMVLPPKSSTVIELSGKR